MRFSGSGDNSGLVQETYFLSGTDANSYLIADLTRNLNGWYERIVGWVLESLDDWDWDDPNLTNLPRANQAMQANQDNYPLPTDLYKVLRLEYTWDGSIYYKATPLHFKERLAGSDVTAINNDFQKTKPFYQLFANQILVRPIPVQADVDAGASIRLWYARDFDHFITTDTTQAPGFVKLWHRALSHGAAYDFAIAKGKANANALRNELVSMEKEIRIYYINRNKDRDWRFGADIPNYR